MHSFNDNNNTFSILTGKSKLSLNIPSTEDRVRRCSSSFGNK